jgi:hypothetical protein
MKRVHVTFCSSLTILLLFCAAAADAQQAASTPTNSTVPPWVNFSGVLTDVGGKPLADVAEVTFSLYQEQQDGPPLWVETQNVQPDATGHYTVMLGATTSTGLPSSLFVTGEAHWLRVQVQGQEEQPRVFLVSAPYALKAGDAETIGGLPPSAFVLAAPGPSSATAPTPSSSSAASPGSPDVSSGQPVKPPLSGSGTTNYIPIWTSSTALGNSNIQQIGGNVGIGTNTPGSTLDVNGNVDSSTGYKIDGLTELAAPGGSNGFNIALGYEVLITNTTGTTDTASGMSALQYNTTGSANMAAGTNALFGNTTGGDNTATGSDALLRNNIGNDNTASGFAALYSNTKGIQNTASGACALSNVTTGSDNTAIGYEALYCNTVSGNTADGYQALYSNGPGTSNTASGYEALYSTSANDNTADGYQAIYSDSTGANNTADGNQALFSNTSGSDNTATGFFAMFFSTTGSQNTAIGYGALAGNLSGANAIAIGYNAGGAGGNGNNIEIGNGGSSSDSGAIRIGTSGTQTSFFVAGVSGVNVGSAVPVMIDSATGQLGTVSSSRRFKEDIQDMGDASRDLLRLRPVTFRYKQPFADGSKPIQYGLIAEEVAEVYPNMVAHSADGEIETAKYQMLGPMLLNEVQHHETEIRDLQTDCDNLEAALAKMPRGPHIP